MFRRRRRRQSKRKGETDGRREKETGMMKLYHTGKLEIREPDLRRGRKNADFGQGFYLTPDREFTYRWAQDDAVVNEYELDETGLNIRRFDRDEAWFSCIFHNRRAEDGLEADAVLGPIANDTIFDTLGIISSGFLEPAEALKLLQIGPVYMQLAVKTEEALRQLRWTGAERIERQAADLRRAEEAEYQAAFARAMKEISD